MSLFDTLQAGCGPLWQAAQEHPFVSALTEGSLSPIRFAEFLRQDYVFLIAYSRALALACARAESLPLMREFAELLSATLGSEMQLHRDYCAQFGVSAQELEAVRARPACQAYGDFCISTAASGGPLELLCAMLPCSLGYAEVGTRLLAAAQSQPGGLAAHPYRGWIATYSGAEYQAYAQWMRTTLDRLGAETPAANLPRLQPLFDLGCRYEWLFWEMCWTEEEWDIPTAALQH